MALLVVQQSSARAEPGVQQAQHPVQIVESTHMEQELEKLLQPLDVLLVLQIQKVLSAQLQVRGVLQN